MGHVHSGDGKRSGRPRLFKTFVRIDERVRRWKRNCLLIILAILALGAALCLVLAFLVGRASAQNPYPLPLDVLLLIDQSDSMWDKGGMGSDPGLLRVQAANLFVTYLGVDAVPPGSRLGIVHFGGESVLTVPLTPLDSAARRRTIQEAIADPQRMGWTDPLAALQLAYDTLFPQGRRDPARQAVVLLLTDGKPELVPAPSPESRATYVANLRALVERYREQGCPIFTVALSGEATDADPEIRTVYRNLWQEIAARTPPAEYHEARVAGDLLPIYHAVVARLTGAEAEELFDEMAVNGRAAKSITVEEDLSQARFVVWRSDPALDVRLLRPEGVPARPGDPDVRHSGEPGRTHEEVWAIVDPRPGRWTLEFQGQGTVWVWQDVVPRANPRLPAYTIETTALPAYVPAGQSLDVRISLHEGPAGERVGRSGVQIVAEVRRANFVETTLLAHDDGKGCDAEVGDGLYCMTLSDPPAGVCTFHLRALLDGTEVTRREVAFECVPLPELEVVSPLAGRSVEPGAPITVAVRVRAGDHAWTTTELAGQGMLTANLGSIGGSVDIPLTADGDAFVGLAVAPGLPGPFTLTVRLHGQTAEGLSFEDVIHVPLAATAPVEPDAGRGASIWAWPLAGLGVLGALGGVGGLWLWLRRRRAVLEGGLRVLAAPSGQPSGVTLDLPGAPSVALGGTGRGDLLPDEVPRIVLRAARTREGDVETWVAPSPGEDARAAMLNGRPLEAARRLFDGDVLALGGYRLRYESLRQAGAHRARHRPRRGFSATRARVNKR